MEHSSATVAVEGPVVTAVADSRGRGAPQCGAMAASVDASSLTSVITASACWRVKYRKVTPDGEIIRKKHRVESLGVHPKNRGGVYPAGVRCKSLGVDVVEDGFVKEEVNHAGVVVEETPAEHIRSRGPDYVSGTTYNQTMCSKDELLISCFMVPYDDVRGLMLGHNHMMIVLRAFLTGAQWNLPHNEEKNIHYCDAHGCLSLTAVAASPNAKELAEIIEEGITCEILSWRMDVEEPTAASVISHALNRGHELALRTTELTAVAVLKGEIMTQMNMHVGQRVAFQTVRERVRAQLSFAADDPDLPSMFDFLISSGVGRNSYIDDMLEFGTCFVDSKKRQLRFSAFAAANKICQQAPWTRIAVIKRAYRKKPVSGFCPSPESQWEKFEWAHLEKLEELLRFFHVSCKASLAKLKPQSRNKLLANIDVAATDAFWAGKDPKEKNSLAKIKDLMLRATVKYVEALGLVASDTASVDNPWIDFRDVAEQLSTGQAQSSSGPSGPPASAPAIIHFDEESGAQLNTQVDFGLPRGTTEATLPTQLPWREWREHDGALGADEADQAAAVAVLHNLHEGFDVSSQSVELWQRDSHPYAVATAKLAANAILLPPCVPKQSKVHRRSEHPCAVTLTAKVMRSTQMTVQPGKDNILRVREYSVMPEFKVPEKEAHLKTAVADGAPQWIWRDNESMHPFWAVRRMTAKQLTHAQLAHKAATGWSPRFNCTLEMQTLSAVCLAVVGGQALNRTRIIEVPFLTNNVPVEEGEELILEIGEKEKKTAPKRSWQSAMKDEEMAAAKAAKNAKKEEKRAAVAGGVS